eukprot:365807-Chlamydomonas_euryale.AAC.14
MRRLDVRRPGFLTRAAWPACRHATTPAPAGARGCGAVLLCIRRGGAHQVGDAFGRGMLHRGRACQDEARRAAAVRADDVDAGQEPRH